MTERPRFLLLELLLSIFLYGGSSAACGVKSIPANHPFIRYSGRWDFSDSLRPRYSWPGASVSAAFKGTKIGARLDDHTNYYNVFIDGLLHAVFHPVKPGESDYILADSLTDTRHMFTLSRRNIAFDEIYTFCGLILDGADSLLPGPPQSQRRIEFLGDSFTAAESDEAKEQELPWEARFPVTNIDRGFAAIIARHFGAESHMTCRSGIGMVCDWQGNPEMTIPKRFDRTFMDAPLPKWDFARWVPGVVVICLGLNDYSGLRDSAGAVPSEKSAMFRDGYRRFLTTLRGVYPHVKIVAVAPFAEWIRANVRQVVDEERSAGREDVFYTQFDRFEGGYVANGHPTVATHMKMADQIIRSMESFHLFPSGS